VEIKEPAGKPQNSGEPPVKELHFLGGLRLSFQENEGKVSPVGWRIEYLTGNN